MSKRDFTNHTYNQFNQEKMTEKNSDPNEFTEKIEIFSTEDEKIKSFGELLTNDSSRKILQLLMKEELTALDISKKTELSLPLVIYHLNKMQDLNVIQISKIGTNVKGQDMKFYKATKFAVVILPSSVSEKAKESKSLIRSFNSIYRFAGIAIAGIAAWFGSVSLQEQTQTFQSAVDSDIPAEESSEIREFAGDEASEKAPSSPAPLPEAEPSAGMDFNQGEQLQESLELEQRAAEEIGQDGSQIIGFTPEDFVIPVIITMAVIGVGLFLELLYRRRISKNKQEQKL